MKLSMPEGTPTASSCRDLPTLCGLGELGPKSIEISGRSAARVKASRESGRKDLSPVDVLKPGQFDLVIILAGPSEEDDQIDTPAQDDSGETIIDFVEKAGLDLERVYITNLVKCFSPKKGRKPASKEVRTCRDLYLRREIEAIDPKAVIVVGAQSLKAFNISGQGSLNAIHGKIFDLRFPRNKEQTVSDWEKEKTYKVIPTLSPASFFYRPNPKLKARIAGDYRVAKRIIDGLPVESDFQSDYLLVDTVEKLETLKSHLLNSTMFGWDTEQAAMSFRKSPTISYQFAWGWNKDQCAVIPITQHDPDGLEDQEFHLKPGFGELNEDLVTQFMRDVFLTPNIAKCAHHHKFDINVLRWDYGIEIEGFLFDTLSMKHLQDEQPPNDLAFLCDLEFGWGDYEADRRAVTGTGKKLRNTFDKVPDDVLWAYGAIDALGTYRLCCLHAERLAKRENLQSFHAAESEPLQRSLARAEYRGAKIHTGTMDALRTTFEGEMKALLTRMKGVTGKPDFNPMSPPQVLSAFLAMGVPSVDLEDDTKVSGYSAGKKSLTDIVEGGVQPQAQFSEDIMTFRNRRKMISTYIDNAKNDLDSDGRLRYSWRIAGPVTGRLSCTFFHQIPKIDQRVTNYGENGAYVPFEQRIKDNKLVLRDVCVADEGYKYVYGDFSQVELRIGAVVADDKEMLEILSSPDGDLHTATTYEILKNVREGYTEEIAKGDKFNRTEVGKRINFGLWYGSEGHALIKSGKWQDADGKEKAFTWEMLNAGMARWKARFKGVSDFIEFTPDRVRSTGGTATNVFGRERHFGNELQHPEEWKREAAGREAINFFIQSPAASITNRTIINVDRVLAEHGIKDSDVCLVNTVHDSVIYEVKDHLVSWMEGVLRVVAAMPYPELKGASFKMDIGSGRNWTDAEMAS